MPRYNEEYGWTPCTVTGVVQAPGGGLEHTLRFDVDGTSETCPLEFGNGMRRWRPLR